MNVSKDELLIQQEKLMGFKCASWTYMYARPVKNLLNASKLAKAFSQRYLD